MGKAATSKNSCKLWVRMILVHNANENIPGVQAISVLPKKSYHYRQLKHVGGGRAIGPKESKKKRPETGQYPCHSNQCDHPLPFKIIWTNIVLVLKWSACVTTKHTHHMVYTILNGKGWSNWLWCTVLFPFFFNPI